MRTTINDTVDRRGGAYSKDDLENVLNDTRKLLADTKTLLEDEKARLRASDPDPDDPKRHDAIQKLLGEVRKTTGMVLEMEGKLGIVSLAAPPIDMEAARDEILRRLTRLATASRAA